VSTVSLRPEDVDVIVFWTRNPRPLFPHLAELDALGHRYYFQYTILGNPRLIDPKSPPLEAALETFRELADRIGPERVVWRYDPIVLTEASPPAYHCAVHTRIAEALAGKTHRNVISIVDVYRKARKRLYDLQQQGITVAELKPPGVPEDVGAMLGQLSATTRSCGMEIYSCAEELDLLPYGIRPGRCIDDEYINRVFGLRLESCKDPNQREACGCVVSKDIGMYDTCLFGCTYCYATNSFETAVRHHRQHDPKSSSLLA
jgi:hypothetical protein